MSEKDCRNCKYYKFTPVGIFPMEICSKHYKENFSEVCEDYTLPLWSKIKKKLKEWYE